MWFGTLVGVVMGLFMYWLTKSRRHLGSVSTMRPEFFDIAVDEDYADDAARLLGGFPLPSRCCSRSRPLDRRRSRAGSGCH